MSDAPESKTEGQFEDVNVVSFADLESGKVKSLKESDLCLQSDTHVFQFKYKKPEEDKKFEIKPGVFQLTETSVGVRPLKTELKSNKLLRSVGNASKILNEANIFFSKLDVYEKLELPKKRAILLASPPGMGKSSTIADFCNTMCEQRKGSVVFNWPTSDVDADSLARFLNTGSEYSADCEALILIIEDIGGGDHDHYGDKDKVSSGLLNLLDGVDNPFKKPTFIIATTNHPENMLEVLADRPGRFDLMLQLDPPSYEERIELVEFIAKRKLNDSEKKAFSVKEADNFSIAHLKEIVIRSMLHDKSLEETVKEIINHTKDFKNSFAKKKKESVGLKQ